MKLWAMPRRATQDGRVMVESSDKMWSTGEGNGKPSVFLPWEPHEQYEKANTQNREEKVLAQIPFWLYACCLLRCFNHVQLFATHGLQPTRLLCSGDSLSKNTRVICHALFQGIVPTQRPNPHLLWLLNWHAGSLPLVPPAAKSLQSYLTLCDPIEGSPSGSPVPGILQARTLEWVAISFSNVWKWKVKVKSLSRVRLFATPWTAAYQAPPSMGFSRQKYWSGVPFPSPSATYMIPNKKKVTSVWATVSLIFFFVCLFPWFFKEKYL